MIQVKIWNGYYSVKDCQRNSNYIFVFGDNLVKEGYAGQACIRDQSNAFGVPTCKGIGKYFTDREYVRNCEIIDISLGKLIKKSQRYDMLVFPEDGIGTGLAMLHSRAPKTWEYLNLRLNDLFGIENKLR